MRHISTEKAASSKPFVAAESKATPSTIIRHRATSMGQRVAAFAVGAIVGGGFGYYQMRLDILSAAQEVQDAIANLKLDCNDNQAKLASRITKLERRSAQIHNS